MTFFKILFALSFSACSIASPNCSSDEAEKCGHFDNQEWEGKTWPQDAKELEVACRDNIAALKCRLEFAKRCPASELAEFLDYLRESKKLADVVCDEANPFRQKYLQHIPCLNKNVIKFYQSCDTSVDSEPGEGFCAHNFKVVRCLTSELKKSCGEEGLHVFNKVYQPIVFMNEIFCRKFDV